MSIRKRFQLWAYSAERTSFAKEFVDQMAKVEQLHKQTRQIIDKIRCNAQPNKVHRSEDSLVPEDADSDDRQCYVAALREFESSQSFTDQSYASNYLKNLADVHLAIAKIHEKFLRQVQVFCVKEMRKFVNETYATIKQAYSDLEKKRDAYDLARHKLKSCKGEEVDDKGAAAANAQNEFEQQAMVLYEILQKMPDHEKVLLRAFHMYTRAEVDYSLEVRELLRKIKAPYGSSSKIPGLYPSSKSPESSPSLKSPSPQSEKSFQNP